MFRGWSAMSSEPVLARVTGNLIVTGPFTYGMFYSTDKATKGIAQVLRTSASDSPKHKARNPAGTKITSHESSSLRDILFYQNAHSVNPIAETAGRSDGRHQREWSSF